MMHNGNLVPVACATNGAWIPIFPREGTVTVTKAARDVEKTSHL